MLAILPLRSQYLRQILALNLIKRPSLLTQVLLGTILSGKFGCNKV